MEYTVLSEADDSTVVSAYKPQDKPSQHYQSEAELEQAFIAQLTAQGYDYLPIHTEQELIANLRCQIERLNHYTFADEDWDAFFREHIANPNLGYTGKTNRIQNDHIRPIRLRDGSSKNIYLIDKQTLANNALQVINQYTPTGGEYDNRYDVTILVNGLPMVHVELKRRGVAIKEAFNQINRYERESFWAGSGLYEYVHIFVISNGTETKYYSNTTRHKHIEKNNAAASPRRGQKVASNSFEFTSYWADRENRLIPDLVDFTATFLNRLTLLNILTRYCVLTCDNDLLVMRPYQICATEAILRRILISSNRRQWGTIQAGGYIWHTTGSGKTLTSFKTAQLASRMPDIDKVLFVVDRKDLDYQTMQEYDRFEKGAANTTRDTATLKRQLENPDCHILITTIQKLSIFVNRNPQHSVYNQHVVLIFDECHRSQFGEMHAAIVRCFRRYHLFGFTGTPIFPENASKSLSFSSISRTSNPSRISSQSRKTPPSTAPAPLFLTTEQAFGERLHTYTIVDAIRDHNVLPFMVSYISTMRAEENISEEQVPNIDRERALLSPERIRRIVDYVLEHYDQKTKRNSVYQLRDKRAQSFNSIFCTASVTAAKAYYNAFREAQQNLPESQRLKIATIFSYAPNEDDQLGQLDTLDTLDKPDSLDTPSSREFLDSAIADYNALFGMSFDSSAEGFQAYYKDVSLRMKRRELDMLIVVNMFLTGFDATTLNTLWVDKNLRAHGLIQAYSRTNRILNSIKTFGNIVCFRNLEQATNDAISLFGDKEAGGLILLRSFDDYYLGYDEEQADGTVVHRQGYVDAVAALCKQFPHSEIPYLGEEQQRAFIKSFGALLRAQNVLVAFDQFAGKEIILPQDMQDYKSYYLDLRDQLRPRRERVDINDDIVFEIELIKQVEINIDYILMLVAKYHDEHKTNEEIRLRLEKTIASSPDLRPKRELIEQFIASLTPESDVHGEWETFVREQQALQIEQIIKEEGLRREETLLFMSRAFEEGQIQENGTDISRILPPLPLFSTTQPATPKTTLQPTTQKTTQSPAQPTAPKTTLQPTATTSPFPATGNARSQKKARVLERLKAFFTRFFDISSGHFTPA